MPFKIERAIIPSFASFQDVDSSLANLETKMNEAESQGYTLVDFRTIDGGIHTGENYPRTQNGNPVSHETRAVVALMHKPPVNTSHSENNGAQSAREVPIPSY